MEESANLFNFDRKSPSTRRIGTKRKRDNSPRDAGSKTSPTNAKARRAPKRRTKVAKKTRPRAKRFASVHHAKSLEDLIAEKRATMAETSCAKQKKELRKILVDLCLLRNKPHQTVPLIRSLNIRADALRKEIKEIESGQRVKELDKKAEHFLEEFYKVQDGNMGSMIRSSQERVIHTTTHRVMPTGKKSKTRNEAVRSLNPITQIDRQQQVTDRFLTEVCGEAPPTFVIPDGICFQCGKPMRVLVEGATLGCPSCRLVQNIPPQAPIGEGISTYAHRSSGGASKGSSGSQTEASLRTKLTLAQAKQSRVPRESVLQRIVNFMFDKKQTGLEEYFKEIQQDFEVNGEFKSFEDAQARLSSGAIVALRSINSLMIRAPKKETKTTKEDTYEDCAMIASCLTGLLPRRMPAALEEKIVLLLRVATPVYREMGTSRQNLWGGYHYFIIAVLQLLGYDEFMEQF